jgi:hypothetical protein
MKDRGRPTKPLDRYTVNDALDRATSHLVRAEYQFTIPGPHRLDHYKRAQTHLVYARTALEEAAGVLDALLAAMLAGG